MRYLAYTFLCCLSLFTFPVSARELVDNATQLSFPEEVTVEHAGKQYQLQATGVATRKKLIVKVYSIASYLQKGLPQGDKIQQILSDENAKQLTMKWARDVDAAKVIETYQDAFHKVFSPEQYTQLQGQIDQFLQFFQAGAKKGDEFVLRWLPGGYVEVLINGSPVGNLNNKEFAKGLWSIWFTTGVVKLKDLVSQ